MASKHLLHATLALFLATTLIQLVNGQHKRCFTCRSRGKLGDCKDEFKLNETSLEGTGVEATACNSGWCLKIIEGKKDGEDHDLATERVCMLRPPPDLRERCAEAFLGVKKVFTCFCKGDLCNTAISIASPNTLILLFSAFLAFTIAQT